MSKLLNRSLKKFIIYAALVLVASVPAYYVTISLLWKYEMDEHNIILTPEAGREDSFLIIGAVTLLTVVFFVLLSGGLILLNRRISRRLWQPFHDSLDLIRNFDLNRQTPLAFKDTDIDEFKELNQSLDKLVSGNIAAYNQQREFADNASHELQTPLSIIQSKLELLIQTDTLTDKQYEIIEEAIKALGRVNRVNKNLLLLTKIENSQFMDRENIALPGLLENTVTQFQNFSESKNIQLQLKSDSDIRIDGNKTLVEILLNNLIMNAIRYSGNESTVLIYLSGRKLAVSNDGTAPLQTTRLFKRFATASSQSPGTGLGLALVKQICNRYNWGVNYDFTNRRHTFTVEFKDSFL